MKKYIVSLSILAITLIACTDKKKTSSKELPNETKVELKKVEKSLDDISNEVKTKSKELDDALDALDNI
ncbi:hypothetical protein [Aquimarina agarilytica]|uniref:hypothetical protein n=1 Tax=Aquimarina agarilytica TaxID=1087449 RepID=UPI0002891062|nr:hypothetical protein [Aquimarina agarilytica]